MAGDDRAKIDFAEIMSADIRLCYSEGDVLAHPGEVDQRHE